MVDGRFSTEGCERLLRATIVTSTYLYKRPPRKRKAVPLEGVAVVRGSWKREKLCTTRHFLNRPTMTRQSAETS
jgi:hypothetical protein